MLFAQRRGFQNLARASPVEIIFCKRLEFVMWRGEVAWGRECLGKY
jgi:hypothetical protein